MTTKTTFQPTVRITTHLLNDLKHGRVSLIPGQWCYSTRDRIKVKYVGTFYRNYNGIITPVVKFSERRPGQTITDWNKTFKMARDISLREEGNYKRQLKRQGKVNERTEFTNPEIFVPQTNLNDYKSALSGQPLEEVVHHHVPHNIDRPKRDRESFSLFRSLKKLFS